MMYYFCNAPKSISKNFIPNNISGLVSLKNFAFCAIFNSSQILVFENKNFSLIAYYQRSQESLDLYGNSINMEWNSDASLIATSTDKGFLLIFSITRNANNSIISTDKEINYSKEGFLNYSILSSATVNLLDVINFNCKIMCLCLYRDDLLVAIEDGTLTRVKWDGSLLYNEEFQLTTISFFNDLEFSKASNLAKNEALCRAIEWLPSLNGVIVLFQNGKSAFLHIPNHKLFNKEITGVWAENLRHASCIAVNVKFRSVAYGLKMGQAVIYKTDEETGALRMQHRLKILCNEYPDAHKITGGVTNLKWSPDNFCLALCWENKGFSLWSVQGSLIFSSLGNKCGIEMNLLSLDWGCEGYSLWIIKKPEPNKKCEVFVFPMAKSVLVVNPTKDNHQHLLLLASSHMILTSRKTLSSTKSNLEYIPYPETYIGFNWPIKYASIDSTGNRLVIAGKYGFAFYFLVSKKWRLFGNETQERSVEVSGGLVWYKHSICLACFDNKEEKFEIRLYNSFIKIDNDMSFKFHVYSQILMMNIFENTLVALSIDGLVSLYKIHVGQEWKSMSLDFIQIISLQNYVEFAACVVSFNLTSLHTDLNNNYNQDINDNIRYQSLLINYSGHVLMFQRDKSSPRIRNNEKSKENSFFNLKFRDKSSDELNSISFTGPLVVAYNVEIMWTPLIYEDNELMTFQSLDWNSKIYTMENSLWLNCGAHGLRVWLPLNGNHMVGIEKKRKHSFLSKRIMLTCRIFNFYPLVVLNNEGILMSPINEFSVVIVDKPYCQNLPFANIAKNRHIFLQHIIKELLRINLGVHALDLTFGLKNLPYFNHSLELLLHEVLEEEATSKEPIPDPLLPRVVAFIQEFPNFLKTVVQCARKTELALWSYLFESAGNPKDLFESCLTNNELDTAASYLIILQNTEHPTMSQKHAILLLTAALYQAKWSLVKNLIRFLKNIAINDLKITEKLNNKSIRDTSTSLYYTTRKRYKSGGGLGVSNTRQFITGKSSKEIENLKTAKFSFKSNIIESSDDTQLEMLRPKGISISTPNPINPESNSFDEFISNELSQNIFINKSKISTSSDENIELSSFLALKHNDCAIDNNMTEFCKCFIFEKEVDVILTQFAHKQFQEYQLYNLLEFFVCIQFTENQCVSWMVREKLFCYKIQDPIQALICLHNDFNWPLKAFLCVEKGLDLSVTTKLRNDFHYEYVCLDSDVNNMELNRRKLRYLSNMLIKADYWEWIFLLLLMMEEYEEIISLFQYFALNINNSSKILLLSETIEFMKTIIIWNIEQETKYVVFLLKIRDSLISLFEERINEISVQISSNYSQLENVNSFKTSKFKEDSLVLSPIVNHSSFTLGQLVIDTNNVEPDIHHNDSSNQATKNSKQIFDKVSSRFKIHTKEKLQFVNNKYSKSEVLQNAFSLSNNCQDAAFVESDPLVSTELEVQNYKLGCSVS